MQFELSKSEGCLTVNKGKTRYMTSHDQQKPKNKQKKTKKKNQTKIVKVTEYKYLGQTIYLKNST